jgi:hypothetical protein
MIGQNRPLSSVVFLEANMLGIQHGPETIKSLWCQWLQFYEVKSADCTYVLANSFNSWLSVLVSYLLLYHTFLQHAVIFDLGPYLGLRIVMDRMVLGKLSQSNLGRLHSQSTFTQEVLGSL